MRFSKSLKYYRRKAGFSSAKEFATRLGLSYSTYVAYENTDREPRFDVLIKIADILNVSIDELLGRNSDGRIMWEIGEKKMRRILFRGWDQETNEWIYGGGLVDIHPKSKIGLISLAGSTYRIDVPAKSVGQYTGFKDCDGEPIYEGDILERDDRELLLVEWDESKGMWTAVQDETHTYSLADQLNSEKQFRVWGNMWEDSSLSEEE
ncbi:YopX family protein [Acidaminococcus massiliensis]|jgi:transcriptional regulator with XRE-family HTH domain|uniref:YopX family protein n=1 Tax=Acidaminococcus massiliensis TaxID=1852375 RepID=UPI00204759E5|nr:YopX family protein [Acidaminococcus massiliensis]DAR24844.1 MAG TPA: helix-turn-helix domain protein [Caudoviricetes sp.]